MESNPTPICHHDVTAIEPETYTRPTRFAKLRRKAEKGATAVEYALMVGLIAVGIIGSVTALRDKVGKTFNTVNTAMDAAPATVPPNLVGWTFGANDNGSFTLNFSYNVKYVTAAGVDYATSGYVGWSGYVWPCDQTNFGAFAPPGGKCYYKAI